MDHFNYKAGELYCEGVSVDALANEFGTPLYVYSKATLTEHYTRLHKAFAALDPLLCYSIKSCSNLHICRLLGELGSGFDVVSGGEIFRGVQAGGDPAKFVYAGVGKTVREMNEAIDAGVGLFNIESPAELDKLIEVTTGRGATVRGLLRVNPDVDPQTHTYTTTGKKENKFGVDLDRARIVFREHGRNEHVKLCGIHMHIGSPVNSVQPYVDAIHKGLDLIEELRGDGLTIDTIDIGGGYGAHYAGEEAPPATAYADAIVPLLRDRGLKVILEPGRSIAANAGILVAEVLYLKRSGEKEFVIVDAAMSDLIRPALYQAFHFCWPTRPGAALAPPARAKEIDLPNLIAADVVGPICESGDFLAKDRRIPIVRPGDRMAVFTAGAYGFTMSNQYNTRPRAAEVLVDGESARTIRRRETYADLVAHETQLS